MARFGFVFLCAAAGAVAGSYVAREYNGNQGLWGLIVCVFAGAAGLAIASSFKSKRA